MSGHPGPPRWAGLVAATVLVVSCAPGSDGTAPTPGPDAPVPGSGAPTASAAPTAAPAPVEPDDPAPVIGSADADLAMDVVRRLADEVGPRPAGSPSDAEARAYVLDAFRAAGWTVQEERFALPQGGTSANVIATPPRVSLDAPHLVVGAHLDTVEGSPGGNDNASGVAVLVAVATELGDELAELPEPVVLVAFGAEEYQPSEPRQHHVGSQAYVDAHGAQVPAMLSVDMVGHGELTCICHLRDSHDDLARLLAGLAEDRGVGEQFRVEARGDISDHGPFALAGIPAAHLWTYDQAIRHTPQDTADRVHAEDLARAADLVLAWLRGGARTP